MNGTPRQQAAFHAMQLAGIRRIMADYDPLLVGTIPLAIDIDSSDLDIIHRAADKFQFAHVVHENFSRCAGFSYRVEEVRGKLSFIANFQAHGFQFELFAQNVPVLEQAAYRHMLVEYRLLEIGGSDARATIRELKQNGVKTEPAFAEYFGIQGDDPFEALLKLAKLDEEALRKAVGR